MSEDPVFFSKLCNLAQMLDTFAIKNIGRMSIHEFTTVVIYYFNHLGVCSPKLRTSLLQKMADSTDSFNEYQL